MASFITQLLKTLPDIWKRARQQANEMRNFRQAQEQVRPLLAEFVYLYPMCKVQYRYASPAQGRSASMHDIVIDSREDACEKAALNYWKLAMRKGNFSIDVSWQPNDKRPLSIEYETQTCKGEDYQESVLSDTRGQEELLRLWQ